MIHFHSRIFDISLESDSSKTEGMPPALCKPHGTLTQGVTGISIFLGFGLYLKGEDFCITLQDCRSSSKWRVISRSSRGECSLTFLASINSGQSLSQIGQMQTPLQKEDDSYSRLRLPVRFQSLVLGKISANIFL